MSKCEVSSCCAEPPCSVSISVISQQRSASFQKCGINPYVSGDNRRFKKATTKWTKNCSWTGSGTQFTTIIGKATTAVYLEVTKDNITIHRGSLDDDGNFVAKADVGDCTLTNENGAETESYYLSQPLSEVVTSCPDGIDRGFWSSGNAPTLSGSHNSWGAFELPGNASTTYTATSRSSTSGSTIGSIPGFSAGCATFYCTLEDEFTDSELKDLLLARLADAEWVSSSNATASYSISDDNLTTGAIEAKYFVRLSAPDVAFCKVTAEWDEVFTPDGGGASSVMNTRTLSWDIGATCYPGTLTDAKKDSPEYTLSRPTTPGTISLSAIRYSCDGVPS